MKGLPKVKGVSLNGGEHRMVEGQAVEISGDLYELGLPMISVD